MTFLAVVGAAMLCGTLGLLAAFCGSLGTKAVVDRQRAHQSVHYSTASEISSAVGGNPFSSLFALPYCRVCKRLRRGRVPRHMWRDWRRLYNARLKGWTDPHDGWWPRERASKQDADA